jgi:hypothetical protein
MKRISVIISLVSAFVIMSVVGAQAYQYTLQVSQTAGHKPICHKRWSSGNRWWRSHFQGYSMAVFTVYKGHTGRLQLYSGSWS